MEETLRQNALGRSAGPVQNVIMALPNAHSWKAIREDVETEDEVNLIKDVRARCNACYKCGEYGTFPERLQNMMVINHQTIGKIRMEILIL